MAYNYDNDKVLWSVELADSQFSDDLFNGTFMECIEYCFDNGYILDGVEARLAEVLIRNNVVEYVYRYFFV